MVRSILKPANRPKGRRTCGRAPARRLVVRLEVIADLEADADPVGQQRHALAFWDHIVDGASIVFRLMFNTLRAAYEPALPALATMMSAAEVGNIAAYRTLASAVLASEPAAAEAAARNLSSRLPRPCSPH